MKSSYRGIRGVRGIRILGVMTGTSCDGLDATCMEADLDGWQVLWQGSWSYPASLRKRVIDIQKPECKHPLRALLELDRDLGDWYGAALARLIAKIPPKHRPDAIANHGQTVGHYPSRGHKGTTFQIGDPTRIAHATGLTVVAGFRKGDMAAGGQGAPLVPLYHRLLAAQLPWGDQGIAIHNIGGISNLTYIGPKGEILAFDTGPGNIWIDAAAERATGGKSRMDRDGKLALKGVADEASLNLLLKNPYFKMRPPKSTGRDEFPFELFRKTTRVQGAELVATATWLTIETISRAYEQWILGSGLPLSAVYLCGGGARNPAIVAGLKARLPSVDFADFPDHSFDPRFIEAQAFAFFGFLALLGKPLGGTWTGAKGFGPPGHIVPGSNWLRIVEKIKEITR